MAIAKCWRLAIAAGVSQCLVYAEAKYCAFEMNGEPKYYVCPKTEYCCNFGCCVSPGFQMYHLWYYWLLAIVMFLVCSGGGWWYRYWLHGRFRTTASTIPNRSSGTRAQSTMRDPTCRAQQARISYNTARNTVLLHRMWKAHRGVTSPAYSAAGPGSSAAHYQNTSVVLNDVNCPYYQLYGPPPSYETVIAQSRGKLSTPSSPELLRPGQSRAAEASYVGPCFYNVRPLEAPQYQPPPPTATCSPTLPGGPRLVDGFDTAEYVRLVQQQYAGMVAAGPTIVTSPRHQPFHAAAAAAAAVAGNGSKSSDNMDGETMTSCSQADSPEAGGFPGVGRIDCPSHACLGLDRPLPCYSLLGKSTCRVAVHGMSRLRRFEPTASSSSHSELPTEPSTSSGLLGSTSDMLRTATELQRRIQGGSLKIPRRRELRHQQQQQQQQELAAAARASRRLSTTMADYYNQIVPASRLDCLGDDRSFLQQQQQQQQHQQQQSIPSSNVIAAANSSLTAAAATASTSKQNDEPASGRHQQQQQQQCPPAAPSAAEWSSTNSNAESKRKKLDRSKSLD